MAHTYNGGCLAHFNCSLFHQALGPLCPYLSLGPRVDGAYEKWMAFEDPRRGPCRRGLEVMREANLRPGGSTTDLLAPGMSHSTGNFGGGELRLTAGTKARMPHERPRRLSFNESLALTVM
ncbi:unnamed protein product [Protopolystoma xenopodis]|uniref:Uncharacterized protein n=1 Tax=Protopolystoma xenopodis TaxID=117903 RepID=A0A3S5CUP3_9PLAT|nr:unnamed protein product [Protopolystoma xenopodis]